MAGASVQGRDHRAAGRENQDAFSARVSPDGQALILAVSDGAGSQPRSALGSHIAVDSAVRVLGVDLPGAEGTADQWQSWLSRGARAIVDDYLRIATAASPGDPPEELAATLAAAIICPPWAGFVSVGDSFGAVLTAGPPERCQLVIPPQINPGGTDFISSPWAKDMLRCLMLHDPELSGVVLSTDGCAALALDHPAVVGLDPAAGPQPSAAFFVGLAAAIRADDGDSEPIHRLLTGERAGRCTDDLTVLCALTA